MSVTDMTKGNPAKLILRFAFPIIITNLGQQFYMITDAAIVGRGVGVEALAAIGCTDWTYWVVLWSVSAMTQGFATFIARYFGQQNYKMMNRSLAMSIILSLAIALLFTGLGIALAKPILNLLETPKAILFDAVTYLTTMLAGTVIITGYICRCGWTVMRTSSQSIATTSRTAASIFFTSRRKTILRIP